MGRTTCRVLGVVFSAVLVAQTAEAGRRGNRAKREFKRAQRAAELGHFEEAIKAYEKAYALKPLPAILFNIGKCHKYLGHYDKAVYFIESFINTAPREAERVAARRELKEARALLAETSASTGPPAQDAPVDETGSNPDSAGSDGLTPAGVEGEKPADTDSVAASNDDGGPVPGTGIASPDPDPSGPIADDGVDPAAHEGGVGPVTPPGTDEPAVQREAWWQQWWVWAVAGTVVAAGVTTAVVLGTSEQHVVAPSGSLGTVDFRP